MMMRSVLFAFLLTCFLQSELVARQPSGRPVTDIIRIMDDPKTKQVLVAAHRGDWHNFPENSLEAVLSAVRLGVDIVEIDLQQTSDGQLVLMHDKTVDRVTNGRGEVSSFTLDSLRKLRLKNGLGRITVFGIPTLEEVMRAVKGKVMVNLDKGYDYLPKAMEILERTGTLEQAIAKSEYPVEKVLKEYGPFIRKIRYMPVVALSKPAAANLISGFQRELKPVAFELVFSSDTSAVLRKPGLITSGGSKIWINSLWPSLNAGHDDDRAVSGDVEGSYDWILKKGATIIQTDRPEFLIAYLRKKGLHR